MLSLNFIMIWFIDEYRGAFSKDYREKFSGVAKSTGV